MSDSLGCFHRGITKPKIINFKLDICVWKMDENDKNKVPERVCL